MVKALEQAKEGRLHILDEMSKVLKEPRSSLPETVPKIRLIKIDPDKKGKLIGPGGKQIRAIIEDYGLTELDADEEGNAQICGYSEENITKAEIFIKNLLGSIDERGGGGARPERPKYAGPPAVVGKMYKGRITGVHSFGVFVEIMPGAEDGSYPGLDAFCHVSELSTQRVVNCESFVASLGVDELEVIYLGEKQPGRHSASRQAVIMQRRLAKKAVAGKNGATIQKQSSAVPVKKSIVRGGTATMNSPATKAPTPAKVAVAKAATPAIAKTTTNPAVAKTNTAAKTTTNPAPATNTPPIIEPAADPDSKPLAADEKDAVEEAIKFLADL